MDLRTWAVPLTLGLFPALMWAQPALYLKSGRQPSRDAGAENFALAALPPASGGQHRIVQFQERPTAQDIQELQNRGATVLDYVPENALLVSAPAELSLDGLSLAWTGTLQAGDKVSRKLLYASGMAVVAEFHRDTAPERMRALALNAGLAIRENPDLLAHQLLVAGDPEQLWQLAEADEVAYLYPPAAELASGIPVRACAGALTASGTIGQYTARVGEGWDGPGQHATALRYVLGNLTGKLAAADIRTEILRALTEWSNYVEVTFSEGNDALAPRTVAIQFAQGSHGDDYPFDGPGGVLAHTFYPAPPNVESIAGDMHLDDEENWQVGSGTDLYSVVLHELGHALGLAHSDTPGTVMYPFYRLSDRLTTEDIETVRQLYAAREPAPAPSPLVLEVTRPAVTALTTREASIAVGGVVSGGSGAVVVAAASDAGGGGQASVPEGEGARAWEIESLALAVGANHLTITATDAAGNTAVRGLTVVREEPPPDPPAPPILRIVNPGSGLRTTSDTLSLAGTASHASGIAKVEWRASSGQEGTAAGGSEWAISPVPLQPGVNVITVTARSNAGTSASASISVEYRPPAEPDETSPSLTITSPFSTSVVTSAAAIWMKGTAQDNRRVTEVTWSTSGGSSGTAPGTTFWGPVRVPLLVGANSIIIRAFDAAGNTAWRSLVVTRR